MYQSRARSNDELYSAINSQFLLYYILKYLYNAPDPLAYCLIIVLKIYV
jgi:hypothetical protein